MRFRLIWIESYFSPDISSVNVIGLIWMIHPPKSFLSQYVYTTSSLINLPRDSGGSGLMQPLRKKFSSLWETSSSGNYWILHYFSKVIQCCKCQQWIIYHLMNNHKNSWKNHLKLCLSARTPAIWHHLAEIIFCSKSYSGFVQLHRYRTFAYGYKAVFSLAFDLVLLLTLISLKNKGHTSLQMQQDMQRSSKILQSFTKFLVGLFLWSPPPQ